MSKINENKLWKWFSEFIRLRDAAPFTGHVKCFTCGNIRHWRGVDCGHGIPRQWRATKYNEQNNHAQCKHCNGFEGGAREAYKAEMDKRYGEGTWDKMMVLSKQVVKWGQFEVDMMAEYYKKEAEKLKLEKKL